MGPNPHTHSHTFTNNGSSSHIHTITQSGPHMHECSHTPDPDDRGGVTPRVSSHTLAVIPHAATEGRPRPRQPRGRRAHGRKPAAGSPGRCSLGPREGAAQRTLGLFSEGASEILLPAWRDTPPPLSRIIFFQPGPLNLPFRVPPGTAARPRGLWELQLELAARTRELRSAGEPRSSSV